MTPEDYLNVCTIVMAVLGFGLVLEMTVEEVFRK